MTFPSVYIPVARFGVFTAVKIQAVFFRVVTLRSDVAGYRCPHTHSQFHIIPNLRLGRYTFNSKINSTARHFVIRSVFSFRDAFPPHNVFNVRARVCVRVQYTAALHELILVWCLISWPTVLLLGLLKWWKRIYNLSSRPWSDYHEHYSHTCGLPDHHSL